MKNSMNVFSSSGMYSIYNNAISQILISFRMQSLGLDFSSLGINESMRLESNVLSLEPTVCWCEAIGLANDQANDHASNTVP